MGNYTHQSPQSRPVLVTLNSTASIHNILFNCKSLPVGVSVKPDLTMEERKVEFILLHVQERWRLIQSGMKRKSICLKGTCIFVNNRLHRKMLDSVLSLTLSLSDPAPHLKELALSASSKPDSSHTAVATVSAPAQQINLPVSTQDQSTNTSHQINTCLISKPIKQCLCSFS